MGYLIKNLNEIVSYEKNLADVYRYLIRYHPDKIKSLSTLKRNMKEGYHEINGLEIEKSDEISTKKNKQIESSIIQKFRDREKFYFE
jgi:hypothetical protein